MTTEDPAGAKAPAHKAKEVPRTPPMEQFVLMIAVVGSVLLLIDPAARALTGNAVGAVLEPTIGFHRQVPALTIVLASLVMVVLTTYVRHYFTDYLQVARNAHIMRAFNKEMRDARKENNLHKMKKLGEKNQEIMKLQADQMPAQLKPMAITMVVVVPIFAWLLHFLDPGGAGIATGAGATNPICETVARVPWDGHWCLDINIQWNVLGFVPRWVALYSLFSIPLGQVLGRLLKARDLEAELAKERGAPAAE